MENSQKSNQESNENLIPVPDLEQSDENKESELVNGTHVTSNQSELLLLLPMNVFNLRPAIDDTEKQAKIKFVASIKKQPGKEEYEFVEKTNLIKINNFVNARFEPRTPRSEVGLVANSTIPSVSGNGLSTKLHQASPKCCTCNAKTGRCLDCTCIRRQIKCFNCAPNSRQRCSNTLKLRDTTDNVLEQVTPPNSNHISGSNFLAEEIEAQKSLTFETVCGRLSEHVVNSQPVEAIASGLYMLEDDDVSAPEEKQEESKEKEPPKSQIIPGHGRGRVKVEVRIKWNEQMRLTLLKLHNEDKEMNSNSKGCMRRLKEKWDAEMPEFQNIPKEILTKNARRFAQEPNFDVRDEDETEHQSKNQSGRKMNWTKEWKERLVQLMNKVREIKPKSMMTELKVEWDKAFPSHHYISRQALWGSGKNFIKEGIQGSVNFEDQQELPQNENVSLQDNQNCESDENQETAQPNGQSGIVTTNNQADGIQTESEQRVQQEDLRAPEQITEPNETLSMVEKLPSYWVEIFKTQLEKHWNWGTAADELPRKPLKKNIMTAQEAIKMNKIVQKYAVPKVETMLNISNVLYAVGMTLAEIKSTDEVKLSNRCPKRSKRNQKEDRNRTLRRMDKFIEDKKRIASWAECEIHRRRLARKATEKEKRILRELSIAAKVSLNAITISKLRELKLDCIDEIRMMRVKREAKVKTIKKRKNNREFEENEKIFYRKMDEKELHGEAPKIEQVDAFWRGIWETEGDQNLESKWIEEVEKMIEGQLTEEHIPKLANMKQWHKLVMKRKNWTSPGPDGVQNYWVKHISALWEKEIEQVKDIQEGNIVIPRWMGSGRTVLIAKTCDKSLVEKYRPITCLNALYKMVTAVVAEDIQDYLIANHLWDGQQKGTQRGILGTMDNLLVDRAILEESKEYARNLAVAYYDYEKAYDSTPHKWQTKCFKLCKINSKVINILEQLQKIWHTRLELWNNGEMVRSPVINFKRGFFQGDSFSPVGFCVTEIPLAMMLQRMPGYGMGECHQRDVKVNRFYFIDDLKLVQGSEADLKRANGMVKTISNDMGMKFGVSKCAEIVYHRGKMVKGEGLQVKEGAIKSLDPEQNEFYTFLGIEEGDGQEDKRVKERVVEKCFAIVNRLTEMELYERNLIKAINTKAMATVRYSMNICHYTISELKELDVRMRRLLADKRMRGKEESIERLYMSKKEGGRGMVSFEQMYKSTKVMIAIYLCLTEDPMLKKVFQRERKKIAWKNPVREAEMAFEEVGHSLKLNQNQVIVDGNEFIGTTANVRQTVGKLYKKWWNKMLIEEYEKKIIKSVIWKEFGDNKEEGFKWLNKNISPQQVARILRIQEQMIPTKWLQKLRGKISGNTKCRLCNKEEEGVKHWLNSCEYLAGREYIKRHDQSLRVFYAEVLKQYGLEDKETSWFNINVETVKENEKCLIVWNKKIPTHTKVAHSWPDIRIEDKEKKTIWLIDMACPSDGSVKRKEEEKRRNYVDLEFELRTQRPKWHPITVPVVVGVTGAINNLAQEVKKVLTNENSILQCVAEMQKVTVLGSLQMIHRIECGLV
jgi:hypothetical protein